MGYGDEIMATGIAKIEKIKFPHKQIVIGNFKQKIVTQSIVFLNNPNIIMDPKKIDKNKSIHFVNNYPGNRPHIDYSKSIKGKNAWNLNFKPTPGELFFSKDEKDYAKKIFAEANSFCKQNQKYNHKGIIFIETTSVKINDPRMGFKHTNKDWGNQNWDSLINKLKKDYLILQPLHKHSGKFHGVFSFNCSFREACAVMDLSNIYVGPEGGFGHVAAALKKPAVVIFGGWITPKVTGYDFHENVYIDIEDSPCGVFSYNCEHCKTCMKKITVPMIENLIVNNINKEISFDY